MVRLLCDADGNREVYSLCCLCKNLIAIRPLNSDKQTSLKVKDISIKTSNYNFGINMGGFITNIPCKSLIGNFEKILNAEASTHLKESGSANDFCAAFQSRYQYHTNVNYMLANGIYATDLTGLNTPFNSYWIIITFNTSNDVGDRSHAWIAQFAISTDSNDKAIYFRRNINYTPTTWESWNRLVAS